MVDGPRDLEATVVVKDRLDVMFALQADLQLNTYGRDPSELEGEERIQFIKDMNLALQDELHEFLGETGWKPWATSRHVNTEEARGELVDAWHFFMNLCLVVGMTPDDLFTRYIEKRARNAQRQADGYDGVEGKCHSCHRAFDDLAKAWALPLDRVHEKVRIGTIRGDDNAVPVQELYRDYCIECAGGVVIVDD